MPAGKRRERVTFAKRIAADDGMGNTVGAFADQFTRWAEIRPMRGGETVIASRLEGVRPVLIIVLRDSETETIGNDWKATDDTDGRVYAIKSIDDMDRDRKDLTLIAEAGVNAG